MTLRTKTLDLKDRVSQIEDRLDEIEQQQEELKENVRSQMEEQGADEPEDLDNWDELSTRWENLDGEQIELQGDREKFIETVVVWCTDVTQEELNDLDEDEIEAKYGEPDSCPIEIAELTFGQLQSVSDDMVEESFDVDMERQEVDGTPRQGFYKIETLREAIEKAPDGAPTREDEYGRERPAPGDYPISVGEWLFEKVDAFNTTGETEMGNSSLKEALKFKK